MLGWFGNGGDDTEVFVQALEEASETVSFQVIGAVILFEARYPRQLIGQGVMCLVGQLFCICHLSSWMNMTRKPVLSPR